MAVAVGGPRPITAEEQAIARTLVERARAAMAAIADYDQATVDRLCRAVAWAGGNEQTAIKLANMPSTRPEKSDKVRRGCHTRPRGYCEQSQPPIGR